VCERQSGREKETKTKGETKAGREAGEVGGKERERARGVRAGRVRVKKRGRK